MNIRPLLVCLSLGLASAGVVRAEDAAAPLPAQLDLETALQLALEHNYAIRQARARYAEATGALETSRAGRLPTVSASGNYQRIDSHLIPSAGGISFGSETSWNAGVQARQTLYAGGAVTAGIRSARANRDAAVADFDGSVQTALLTVRERFYDVLLARQQVDVQEESVNFLQDELANANARVQAGTGSPFDKLRAEVALANGQPPLIRARNDYRLAAVDLLQAIGLPSPQGAEGTIVGSLNTTPHEYDLDALISSARDKRPELMQLKQLVTAAEHAVDVAGAASRPTAAAVAGYSVQKSSFSSSGATLDGWTVGVQGSWDIFDGKATRGRVAQARARLQQAKLSYDETALTIETQVRRAYSSYGEARELVTASERVVDQAQESLRLARSRENAGAATQLDVLQAQVALTEARTNAALAQHGASIAQAELERAAGMMAVPEGAKLQPASSAPAE